EVLVVDLVSVIDQDDVGMRELGGGLGLALKAADDFRVLREPILANDLERDNAVEPAVQRLEDLAHAAFAKKLEDAVGAEDEIGAVALEDLIGLVGGEPAALDEDADEGHGVLIALLQIVYHLF